MGQQLLLQVIGLIIGGGTVQLVIFLLRRRSELKALDRTSEASLLTGASDFMARMQVERGADRADLQRLREEAQKDRERFEEQIAQLRVAREQERRGLIAQLTRANEENGQLHSMIAQLRVELNIAKRQIDQLQSLLDRPQT